MVPYINKINIVKHKENQGFSAFMWEYYEK